MFKVVSKNSYLGTLESAVIDGKGTMTYEPDKWTHERKYGPFVFRNKKAAIDYLNEGYGDEVWRCDVKDARRIRWGTMRGDVEDKSREVIIDRMDKIAALTDEQINQWQGFTIINLPAGTYCAKSIKLREKVA